MLIDRLVWFVKNEINCIEIIRVKKFGLIGLGYLKQLGRPEPFIIFRPTPVDVDLAERMGGLTSCGLLS